MRFITSFLVSGGSDEAESVVTYTVEDMDTPVYGLALHPRGHLVLADPRSACVRTFDRQGDLLLTIKDVRLRRPSGVCVTHSGKYVVSDSDDADLKVFSRKARLLVTSEKAVHLQQPSQVTYNTWTKEMAVVDGGACCVYIHDPQGVVKVVLTEADEGNFLVKPHDVTFDKAGNIYVTDCAAHQLVVYNSGHKFLYKCGQKGDGDGDFDCPMGVTFNQDGNLLVADCNNSRVQLLDKTDGRFLGNVLNIEDGLTEPQCVAVTPQGHLVVAESSGLVKLFEIIDAESEVSEISSQSTSPFSQ